MPERKYYDPKDVWLALVRVNREKMDPKRQVSLVERLARLPILMVHTLKDLVGKERI